MFILAFDVVKQKRKKGSLGGLREVKRGLNPLGLWSKFGYERIQIVIFKLHSKFLRENADVPKNPLALGSALGDKWFCVTHFLSGKDFQTELSNLWLSAFGAQKWGRRDSAVCLGRSYQRGRAVDFCQK